MIRDEFSNLMESIRQCKLEETCPALTIRQFYFEPNKLSLNFWQRQRFYSDGINKEIIFVCESPGPSAEKSKRKTYQPCFWGSSRDQRFMDVRSRYGLNNSYVTNMVKCGVRKGGRHTENEINLCKKFLLEEIALINPIIIVAVGLNSYRSLREMNLRQMLFRITHFSSRGNVWDKWDKEFPELLQLLNEFKKSRVYAVS